MPIEQSAGTFMTPSSGQPAITSAIFYVVMISLGAYFTFAAVRGDFGLFKRMEIHADRVALEDQRDALAADVARIQNLNSRLSTTGLDLDLLDERARDVLGLVHRNDIVLK